MNLPAERVTARGIGTVDSVDDVIRYLGVSGRHAESRTAEDDFAAAPRQILPRGEGPHDIPDGRSSRKMEVRSARIRGDLSAVLIEELP